jgi:hypothetical protein
MQSTGSCTTGDGDSRSPPGVRPEGQLPVRTRRWQPGAAGATAATSLAVTGPGAGPACDRRCIGPRHCPHTCIGTAAAELRLPRVNCLTSRRSHNRVATGSPKQWRAVSIHGAPSGSQGRTSQWRPNPWVLPRTTQKSEPRSAADAMICSAALSASIAPYRIWRSPCSTPQYSRMPVCSWVFIALS